MLKAIDRAIGYFPNGGYWGELNRERLKAFLEVLTWTGMRISDAVQFSKDTVKDGQVVLTTQKNGKRVSIPLHADTQEALKTNPKWESFLFLVG
jgi:site-specific recombinase XerD